VVEHLHSLGPGSIPSTTPKKTRIDKPIEKEKFVNTWSKGRNSKDLWGKDGNVLKSDSDNK
jgi:hypothetical protein